MTIHKTAIMLRTCLATIALVMLGASMSLAQTIRIGAPLPLTGPLSPEGEKQRQGYDLWAEQVNATGGIDVGGTAHQVEIVYYDYQSKTPRAVQLAEKLITDDEVDFLFSPFGSGATKAASGVSERYGVPTIAATASSEAVYNQGYRYLFGTFTPNRTLTEPLSQIVKDRVPDVESVAVLARNDLFPLAIAAVAKESAQARDFDLVYDEKYAIGTMDHAAALTQMRASEPDWIFVTGYVNDLILIRKQMAEQNVSAPVVTMIAGPAYREYIDATGELAENVSSAAWWHPSVRYDGEGVFGETEKFNGLFREKYNSIPDYTQASSAAAGVIFQLAIEKAGTLDRDAVRDALANMDAMTFYGPVRFAETGQISSLKPPVFQIQDRDPVVIYPQAIKQGELRIGVE